jgi:CECR6/TMEM121 family
MLVIRSVIWHVHKKEASVFVIKNVLGIGIAVHEIHAKMMDVQVIGVPTEFNGHEMDSLKPATDMSSRDETKREETTAI